MISVDGAGITDISVVAPGGVLHYHPQICIQKVPDAVPRIISCSHG